MKTQRYEAITSIRTLCRGCRTTVPISYPVCPKCGLETPSLEHLKYATLRLRMLNEQTEARTSDESDTTEAAPVLPTQADESVESSSALSSLSLEPGDPTGAQTNEAHSEPMQIAAVRTKRTWRLPFLRKAS